MTLLLLLLFLSVLSLFDNTHGELLNDYYRTRVNATTGAEFKSRVIEAELSSTSPEQQFVVGDTTHTMTALGPRVIYDVVHIAGLTIEAKVYSASARIVDSLIKTNASRITTDDPTIISGSTSRRLLGSSSSSIRHPTSRKLLGWSFAGFAKTAFSFVPGFGDIAESAIAGITHDAEWCRGSKQLFGGCPDDSVPKDEMINYLRADSAWVKDIEAFQIATLQAQNITNQQLQAALDSNFAQQKVNNLTESRVNEIAALQQSMIADMQRNQETTAAVLAELQARNAEALILAQATNKAELEAFANSTKTSIISVIGSLKDFRNDTIEKFMVTNRRINNVDQIVGRLAATLHDYMEDTAAERALSKLVWDQILFAISQGMVPFLLSGAAGGQPPSSEISATDRIQTVDTFIHSYFTVGAGQQAIYTSQTIEYTCDRDLMGLPTFFNMNFETFIRTLGPSGCATFNSEPNTVLQCDCWLTFKTETCRPTASFALTSFSKNASFSEHQMNPITQCASNYQVAGPTIVDTASEVITRLQNLCLSGLASTFPRFLTVSKSTFTRWFTNDVTDPNDCIIDTSAMFITGAKSNTVIARMLKTIFERSWFNAREQSNDYNRIQNGLLPQMLDVFTLPYQADTFTGEHYTYHQALFSAMSPVSVPVFLVTINREEALVIDTSDEATVHLGSLGFTGPNGALPGSKFLIFGDLRPDSTYLYDPPIDMQSYASSPIGREGSVTYSMCPIPDGYDISMWDPNDPSSYPETCTPEEWIAQNKYRFQHKFASIDLSDYRRELSNGVCVGDEILTSGPLCTMLKFYRILPVTNIQNGVLSLEAKEFNYPLIPLVIDSDEPIYEIIQSECPDVEYTGFTEIAGGAGQLVFINRWPFEIKFIAKRTSDSPNCAEMGDIPYTLPAKKNTYVRIPTCHNYILTIYRIDAANNQILCPPSVNITHDPQSSTNIHPADIGASNETTVATNIIQDFVDLSKDAAINFLQSLTFERGEAALSLPEYRAMNNSQLAEAIEKMRGLDVIKNLTAVDLYNKYANVTAQMEKTRIDLAEATRTYEEKNQVLAEKVAEGNEALLLVNFTVWQAIASGDFKIEKANELIAALQRTHVSSSDTFWIWIAILAVFLCVAGLAAFVIYVHCCKKSNGGNRGDFNY